MVTTCVDYALQQISMIQAIQQELEFIIDYDLYDRIRTLWKKAGLGDLKWYSHPFERISETDVYWEESYPKIQSCKRELMFLKMMFWCFATWEDTEDANLRSVLTTLEGIWEDLGERIDDTILSKLEPGGQDWDLLVSLLEARIQQCKSLMVYYYCHVLLGSSLQCKPLPSDQILQFLELVLHNLEALDAISPVKLQFHSLKERLNLSRSFFRFITPHEDNCDELRALMLRLQTFANEAAPLVFLFWTNAANEHITFEAKINDILSDMQQKIIKPCGPDATVALYLGALKTIKLQSSDDPYFYEEIVEGLVDLHLDVLVAASMDDRQYVREGLVFLLMFIYNPPEGSNQGDQLAFLYNQIDLLFSKCTYLILSPCVVENDHFTMDKMLLNDFAEMFEETIEKVKQLYVKVQDSSSYNFPRTNGLGFYDWLLQNLESLKETLDSDTTFVPFAKNFIMKIEEELVLLRPFVSCIFELQKEQMQFKETWSQVVNLAYRTEHVINLCSVDIHPIWYNMASLSVILDQIEDMKTKLEKVGANRILEEVEVIPRSLGSSSSLPERHIFH